MTTNDATITKRRIEACATQALLNARNHGGDTATAAADLMCAFVLLSVNAGAPPDASLKAMWDHAKAAVADFWPKGKMQ